MKRFVVIVLVAMVAATFAFGRGKPEDSGQGVHVDKKGIAAGGHDVVAYFSLPAGADPVEGN